MAVKENKTLNENQANALEADKMQRVRDLLLGSHIRETGTKLSQVIERMDQLEEKQANQIKSMGEELKKQFSDQLNDLKKDISKQIQDESQKSEEKLKTIQEGGLSEISRTELLFTNKINQLESDYSKQVSEINNELQNKQVSKVQLSDIIHDLAKKIKSEE